MFPLSPVPLQQQLPGNGVRPLQIIVEYAENDDFPHKGKLLNPIEERRIPLGSPFRPQVCVFTKQNRILMDCLRLEVAFHFANKRIQNLPLREMRFFLNAGKMVQGSPGPDRFFQANRVFHTC